MKIEDKFRTGYLRERGPILTWLKARIGTEAAEDAFHDVVARSLANLDSMEALRDVGAWLWSAARNAVIDVWRARATRRKAGETELDDFDDLVDSRLRDAHDEAERNEMLELLHRAIDGLPAEQRSIIIDQALNGETFASISRRTGVLPETLAARKRYAIARLRKTLSGLT